MTNETTINLDKADIRKAIDEYIKKRYPTFSRVSMYITYNASECYGFAKGTIREG